MKLLPASRHAEASKSQDVCPDRMPPVFVVDEKRLRQPMQPLREVVLPWHGQRVRNDPVQHTATDFGVGVGMGVLRTRLVFAAIGNPSHLMNVGGGENVWRGGAQVSCRPRDERTGGARWRRSWPPSAGFLP